MAEIDLSSSPARWAGWLVVVAVFGLGIIIFVTVSAINADQMELVLEDGELRVEKGDFLPWGRSTWVPSRAYEPIELPDAAADLDLPLGECEDEDECERRFYTATLAITGAVLAQPTAENLDEARELLVRAQLFPSIPLSERGPIEDLTGGIHYVEALVLLSQVEADLAVVYKKLERSRIAETPIVERRDLLRLIEIVSTQLELLEGRPRPTNSADSEAPVESEEIATD